MRIPRYVIIAFVIIAVCVLTVGAVFCVTCLPGIILDLLTKYHESDPQKMMVYLSNRYTLTFPESTQPIKAATAALDASGNYAFIMKFQMKAEEVNTFLASFEETIDEFTIYNPALDNRLHKNYPEWFKTPIKSGQIRDLSRHATPAHLKNISFDFELYIDTSQNNIVTFYMNGVYIWEGY